jgi:tetratricopeptide (TPR) repeat protein
MEQVESDSFVVNVYNARQGGIPSEERDSKNATFMFFQVLIDTLIKMTFERNSAARQDLIDHFKQLYERNEVQLKLIEEFEKEYQPDKAVWWYTRPTFLYNTLNTALRDSDSEVLFALRFFITDLYAQLTHEHRNDVALSREQDPILRVYRGTNISTKEVKYIAQNIGQYLSMQSFVSTSIDREVARFFVEASAPITNDTTRILLQFNIDRRIKKAKPYAKITQLSFVPDEGEVLIMLGSIFKIDKLEFNKLDQCWIGVFSLCSDDDYELKDLMQQTKSDIGDDITSLGCLLNRHGYYDKAESYYQQILLEPSTQELDRSRCYRALGSIATILGEHSKALENYSKELVIHQKRGNAENIALTLMMIGQAHWKKGDLDTALIYEKKALPDIAAFGNSQLTDVYRTMANIYRDKGDLNLALQNYEESLKLDRKNLPSNHENFGITYGNMALMYLRVRDGEKALEFSLKTKSVWIKSLPSSHPNIRKIDEYMDAAKSLLNMNGES